MLYFKGHLLSKGFFFLDMLYKIPYQEPCQVCSSSMLIVNYKNNNVEGKKAQSRSTKIVQYFPLILRLKRLLKIKKSTEAMHWHTNHRNKYALLLHPANGEAYKSFYIWYPKFNVHP